MTNLLRRGVRVGNEDSDGDRHLHEMIPKPWGRAYRVYVDDFLDVWHLEIQPHRRGRRQDEPTIGFGECGVPVAEQRP